tara:strand:+ start:1416 stop:1664 length:249 start_codon:yes stop_codon:yes gene_type:complete
MKMDDKALKAFNEAIQHKLQYAWAEHEYPTDNDVNKTLILNSIKQTELLQQILLEMKGVTNAMQNGWAHFNREFEGKLRRSR